MRDKHAMQDGRVLVFLSDGATWDVVTGCTVRFYAGDEPEDAVAVPLEALIEHWLQEGYDG